MMGGACALVRETAYGESAEQQVVTDMVATRRLKEKHRTREVKKGRYP
jgi:hypothetical protein